MSESAPRVASIYQQLARHQLSQLAKGLVALVEPHPSASVFVRQEKVFGLCQAMLAEAGISLPDLEYTPEERKALRRAEARRYRPARVRLRRADETPAELAYERRLAAEAKGRTR